LLLSWVGTGRLIFSLNYTAAEFDAVSDRFVTAAAEMKADGWWWHDAKREGPPIKQRMLRELFERGVLKRNPRKT
jgi:glutamate-1-semialdehyde 2,1-aminomutase